MSKTQSVVLSEAIKQFNFQANKTNANLLGNSANMVYEVEQNGKFYILRITQGSAKYVPAYEGEIDWVNYLADNGVNVSKAISSINNKFVECVNVDNSCYLVSAFEKAKGKMPNTKDTNEWNESLFYIWGQTMGQMHALSKKYTVNDISMKRKEWIEDIYFASEYSLPIEEKKVINKWNSIVDKLKSLPKDKNSYGIIHYDFHQFNFFINDGNITVFDFDDCLYHWFTCDIAIALYHALDSLPKTETQNRINFAYQFMRSFLNGYLSENKIDNYWIEKIPLFLDYRKICSFMFVLKLWSSTDINESQQKYIQEMKYNIENDIPVIAIDFKSLHTI